MARAPQTPIRLRIVIEDPVPGVFHSLQDKQGAPVDAKEASNGSPLVFDFTLRAAAGPRFFGDHVRNEGPTRQFVYVAVGGAAGQRVSEWSRRMKIDIHDMPMTLVEAAFAGTLVEITIRGTAADGTPACATIVERSWRAA
jgi:hypothetical protein